MCGFYWVPKRRAWRFDIARMYLHTVSDFREAVRKVKDDRAGVLDVEAAWADFQAKPNEHNWLTYVGAAAAAYMRHDVNGSKP